MLSGSNIILKTIAVYTDCSKKAVLHTFQPFTAKTKLFGYKALAVPRSNLRPKINKIMIKK